jgi:hypothetical protein
MDTRPFAASWKSSVREIGASMRSVKYHWREPGFFRVNVCGWRFVAIDTSRHPAMYSDRANGWRVGPFLFRVSRGIA